MRALLASLVAVSHARRGVLLGGVRTTQAISVTGFAHIGLEVGQGNVGHNDPDYVPDYIPWPGFYSAPFDGRASQGHMASEAESKKTAWSPLGISVCQS